METNFNNFMSNKEDKEQDIEKQEIISNMDLLKKKFINFAFILFEFYCLKVSKNKGPFLLKKSHFRKS